MATAVIIAMVALLGGYFGLDIGTWNTLDNETRSVVQTERVKQKQEVATTEITNQNTPSVKVEQEKEVKQDTQKKAEVKHEKEKSNLTFRNDRLLQSHYQKHGVEMGFSSAEEYVTAANKVLDNQNTLHKTEAEDGDAVYYLETTNEFVVVSTDGYLRTYFNPSGGLDYYNRQ